MRLVYMKKGKNYDRLESNSVRVIKKGCAPRIDYTSF